MSSASTTKSPHHAPCTCYHGVRMCRDESSPHLAASCQALAHALAAFSKGTPTLAFSKPGQPDDLLVRVLAASLQTSSRVSLIATVNPDMEHREDTLCTLRFSAKCCGRQPLTPSTSSADVPSQVSCIHDAGGSYTNKQRFAWLRYKFSLDLDPPCTREGSVWPGELHIHHGVVLCLNCYVRLPELLHMPCKCRTRRPMPCKSWRPK